MGRKSVVTLRKLKINHVIISTLALNKLLEYILSLSLTNNNKDWLAGKIIESKAHVEDVHERAERLYSMFGALFC